LQKFSSYFFQILLPDFLIWPTNRVHFSTSELKTQKLGGQRGQGGQKSLRKAKKNQKPRRSGVKIQNK